MKDKCNFRLTLSKLGAGLCSALVCAIAIPVQANTITVTNTNDNGPGSLRQALADANDGDTITFAVTGTITLTSGELLVDKNVTISGPGAASLAVDGNRATRVFHIGAGKTVSISDLTITNGIVASGNGGGILNDHAILTILNSSVSGNHAHDAGGGISNDADNGGSATLTIMNSIVSGNSAGFGGQGGEGGEGGGIYNGSGTMTITNSSVSYNYAGAPELFPAGLGGGISNYGTLTITDSTINNNECWVDGGGIYNGSGTMTITGSTISENLADGQHDGQPWVCHGGGILGTVTFTNSTLSSNYSSFYGGGIDGGGTITNSTISGNSALVGGGISTGGELEIGNTILNNNIGANVDGTIISQGYNISSDDGGGNLTGPGDQINTDPLLGPLHNNGGPTLTHALLPGSPAINAGNPNFTPPPSYDQRDNPFVRVYNGRIDVGSFELQPPRRATPAPRSRPTPLPRPTPR
jgi:hypothetical protein